MSIKLVKSILTGQIVKYVFMYNQTYIVSQTSMKMFAEADAGRLKQKTKPVFKITVQREARNNSWVP